MRLTEWARRQALRWLLKGQRGTEFIRHLVGPHTAGYPAAWADDPAEQVKHNKHWVFTAIRAIANRVAATPMRLYKRLPNGDAEEVTVTSHPMLYLFEFVNPFHTRFWLWSQTINFLELTGDCYWYIPRNGLQVPGEIWIAHSQYMKIIPDRETFIRAYEYQRGGEKPISFEPDEIIHLKYPNPRDLYYGQSTLQAGAESVDAHEARSTAHYHLMRRGMFSGASFTTDQELGEANIKRLKVQLEQKYATPENAGRPLVLEKGLTPQRIDLAPNEMALLESSSITRDEILSIFGVPAAVVGISEDVARAAADAMDTMFARYCIAPRLQLIADQLNQDLLPRFDERLFVGFEVATPEDLDAKHRRSRDDFAAGVITLNEAREETGREAEDGGDVRYMPMSQVPVGGEDYNDNEGTEAPAEEAPSEGQEKSALRKGARGAQGHAWYKAAYIREQGQYERKATRALQRFFGGQARRVIGALRRELGSKGIMRKDRTDDILRRIFREREEAERMERAALPYIAASLKGGGERTLESIGFAGSFDLDSPEARAFLRGKGTDYWASANAPNATTIDKIHKRIAEGLAAGATPSEIVDTVREVFTEAKASRARRIARTETVGAYNGGGDAVREQLAARQIRTEKGWFTTLDDKTRDDHVSMNNVWVKHDTKFVLPDGTHMNYPGEPGAPTRQVINCRCGTGTEVIEE